MTGSMYSFRDHESGLVMQRYINKLFNFHLRDPATCKAHDVIMCQACTFRAFREYEASINAYIERHEANDYE